MSPTHTEPLRVTIIDPYGVRGGAERWLLELLDVAEGLVPRVIMLREGPLRDDYSQRGIPIDVLPTGPSTGAIARAGLRLPRVLRAHAPDVLLANGVKAAAVAAVPRRRRPAPTVWAKHDFSHDRRIGRLLARRVDLVIGTSRAVVKSIGLPDAPVLAPPRPSVRPADRAGAAEHWRDLGVDVTTGPTAAVVGRLTPYKRVEDAIRALAFGGCEAWRLVVIGGEDWASPGERARLEAVAGTALVSDRVSFTGEVPDVGRWLAAFDAVIMPTGVDPAGFGGEGFGIVVLEGLLAGVPVIATEGIPALALGRDAVISVEQERPDDVAAALQVIRDRSAAARRQADDLWESHPDAEAVASELVQLLRSVQGRSPRG